jgi:hypothetical protein
VHHVLSPPVATALSLQPAQRSSDHMVAIQRLIKALPVAERLPVDAMTTLCRFSTMEVLHNDMVCCCFVKTASGSSLLP